MLLSRIKSNDLVIRAASLAQEEPPVGFRVDYLPKAHATPFGRFDFLNTVVVNMGNAAITAWDRPVAAEQFAPRYGIAIGFVSDRSGPGLQAKHIMWALEAIFDIVVWDDDYLPGNVVVKVGSTALGVGNVHVTPRDSTPVSLLSNASTQLNAHGKVGLQFWYRKQGTYVDDAGVYSATLRLLVRAAEPSDLKAGIWPGITTYNDQHDFTFTIRPQSISTGHDMSWWTTIYALAAIPLAMYRTGGAPGTFMEMDGIINIGETIVGRFCIEKGDKTGLNLQELCNTGDHEGGDDGDVVAIS